MTQEELNGLFMMDPENWANPERSSHPFIDSDVYYHTKLSETGYEPKTTFWQDFTMADPYGNTAVLDTYARSIRDWASDIQYMTELAMVLNWKMWYFYYESPARCLVYQDLWEKTDQMILDSDDFSQEEKSYYIRTTD